MNLSAIIIAKNAESLIVDCLESVRFCDEIIVVDGGSNDKTKDIAKKYGAKIIKGVDTDFAKQRDLGLASAKGQWVFYIDTDERVTPSLRDEILQCINTPTNYAAYKIRRKNYYFGNHPWPYIEEIERLFQRNRLKKWQGILHESPMVHGDIGMLDGLLLHYTHRDLSSMIAKTLIWSQYEAKLRYDAGHPPMAWWRFPRVMWTAFADSYFRQQGYKVGTVGMIESIYQACSIFITYARLWEMQQNQGGKIKGNKA